MAEEDQQCGPEVPGSNSINFLFGGGGALVTETVYTRLTPKNLDKLKIRIRDACESVNMQIFWSVRNDTDCRFDGCGFNRVDHIEIR